MEIVAHVQIHVGWKINMMENLYFYLNKKIKTNSGTSKDLI
jgi:hypothetical protein